MTFDGKHPLMNDVLWWKATFDGRWPWMEDNLGWKTTLDGRRPLIKGDLWWKTTLDGTGPWMEEKHWWKTTPKEKKITASPPPKKKLPPPKVVFAYSACIIPLCGIFFNMTVTDKLEFTDHWQVWHWVGLWVIKSIRCQKGFLPLPPRGIWLKINFLTSGSYSPKSPSLILTSKIAFDGALKISYVPFTFLSPYISH